MKIKNISVQNFKAFQDETVLDLDSKNILIHGNNGSGKSSLYYAFHVLFQSSVKINEVEISKYFDVNSDENLINIYKGNTIPSFIKITTDDNTEYSIPSINFGKNSEPDNIILKQANQASEFLNYRLLFNFYNFRNSQNADLFSIFKNEVFPFWQNDTGETYSEQYHNLQNEIEELERKKIKNKDTDKIRSIRISSTEYKAYESKLKRFNEELKNKIDLLQKSVNDHIKKYFLKAEDLIVYLTYSKDINISKIYKWKLEEPEILLTIKYQDSIINKPHAFLNEARLTALAMSIRMSVFAEKLKATPLKLVFIDDLLISLDMDNRMKIIDYFFNKDLFNEFQFVVMTHDKGFFNILKDKFDNTAWRFLAFKDVKPKEPPKIKDSSSNIDKGIQYLLDGDYEACALYLRKETEKILKKYLNSIQQENFQSLNELINQASNKVDINQKNTFTKLFKNGFDADIISELLNDFENNPALSLEQKGRLNSILKTAKIFIVETYQENAKITKLLNEIRQLKNRILNPSAHDSEAPFFDSELKDAIHKVKLLKDYLTKLEDVKR